MADACVFWCCRRNLPPAREAWEGASQAWCVVLKDLTGLIQHAGQARVTRKLADNNLPLVDIRFIAAEKIHPVVRNRLLLQPFKPFCRLLSSY